MAEMRFNFQEQTNLTPREAAKASGVEEMYIVSGYSTANRLGRTGFNAGGRYFGIVGAVEPPPREPKPIDELPCEHVPDKPGSVCTPKHPSPPREPSAAPVEIRVNTRDEAGKVQPLDARTAVAVGALLQAAAATLNPPSKPARTPAEAQPKESSMQRKSSTELWETDAFPGERFTRDQIAERTGVKRTTVSIALSPSGGKRLGGHDWRRIGAQAADTPPRAPKTRRARRVPTPVATTPPPVASPAPPVLAVSGLQALRDRYMQEHEAAVSQLKIRLAGQLSALADVEQQQGAA